MSQASTVTASLTSAEQIKDKILRLRTALQQQLPNYESLLQIIHMNLSKDPDVVHLLTEEEIGVICAGLQKKTMVVIISGELKKKSPGKGKVALDDL